MNENQLTIVEKYESFEPLFNKIDAIIDNCYRDYHKNFFHTCEFKCEYKIKLTNITNNELNIIKISNKSMGLFELNKKLTVARQKGYIFNQKSELTIKIYCNLQSIIICYYLKHRIRKCHRIFRKRISQNKEYIENFCNDLNHPFHFARRKGFSYNNPQKCCSILILIQIQIIGVDIRIPV